MPRKDKEKKDPKGRVMATKWKSLKARGYTPPATSEENRRRAKEAHGY